MFRFSNRVGRIFCRRRGFTTAAEPSQFEKTTNFFKVNRQSIINTIGMAYVFYYAIYNTKVQVAWDLREAEVAAVKAELDAFKTALSDEVYLSEMSSNIKSGSTAKEELRKKFRNLYTDDVARFMSTGEPTEEGGGGML